MKTGSRLPGARVPAACEAMSFASFRRRGGTIIAENVVRLPWPGPSLCPTERQDRFMTVRITLSLGFVLVLPSAVAAQTPEGVPANVAVAASLREAYRNDFAIGASLGGHVPRDYSAEELALVQRQFSVVTPENAMKMGHLRPAEDRFEFEQADALVAFSQERNLDIVGHTLVWARDDSTPAWIFENDGRPDDRDLVLRRMRKHIETVAGRYNGKIAQWDVVNEAIDDAEGGYLRPSKWVEIAGPGFLAEAFESAHAAAPDAVLIYNDYLTEKPAKRERMLRLLRELLERKAPVHAVGIQGHYELDQVPMQDLEETLVAVRGLGLKVMITELDIAVVPRARWWAEGGKYRTEMAATDPYRDGCPPDVIARRAEQYAALFRLLRRHADVVERVTFWNLHDGRSWLNEFPWKHTEHPLLFDRAARPKPAFEAVLGEGR